MANRRSLLDTGKSAASGVAGTLSSVAGTVKDRGGGVLDRASQGVKESYKELTDDDLTKTEKKRIQRAKAEAEKEARDEAREVFEKEYKENLYDEAFAKELSRLQSEGPGVNRVTTNRGNRKKKLKKQVLEREKRQERRSRPAMSGTSLFGGPPMGTTPAPEPKERAPAPRQSQMNAMSLFGVPQRGPPREEPEPAPQQPAMGGMAMFGPMGQVQEQDESQEMRDPLFGMRL